MLTLALPSLEVARIVHVVCSIFLCNIPSFRHAAFFAEINNIAYENQAFWPILSSKCHVASLQCCIVHKKLSRHRHWQCRWNNSSLRWWLADMDAEVLIWKSGRHQCLSAWMRSCSILHGIRQRHSIDNQRSTKFRAASIFYGSLSLSIAQEAQKSAKKQV